MLSNIFLGTAQFGMNYGATNQVGQLSKKNISRILDKGKDFGVKGLDTSPNYGDSEVILGNYGIKKKFKICTKLPSIPSDDLNPKETTKKYIEKSLRNLKVDFIDYYLLHDENNLYQENVDDILEILNLFKSKGIIKKIGASIYSYNKLMSHGRKNEFDIFQGSYNVADSRFESSGLSDYIIKNDIEFHARSIFLQGILLHDFNNLPSYFKKYKKFFLALSDIQKKLKLSKLELCLGYALGNKRISASIIGVDSYVQFNELIKAAKLKIEPFRFDCPNYEELVNPQRWKL